MGKRGRRARKSKVVKVGDRVIANYDGEAYSGTIIAVASKQATVEFDDGEIDKWQIDELQVEFENVDHNLGGGTGFNQYSIEWDKLRCGFRVRVDKWLFWGSYRRFPERELFVIDVFAQYDDREYRVETIPYPEIDPRENMKSLDADICACVNRFIFDRVNRHKYDLATLHKRSEHPEIRIWKAATLDRLLMKLQEVRDTAYRAGGQREFRVEGDDSDDPVVHVLINITSTAAALEGKVPALGQGGVFDGAIKGKGQKGALILKTPDPKNVLDLCDQLDRCKGDQARSRSIRAILRKMGHRGGARAIRKKVQEQTQ